MTKNKSKIDVSKDSKSQKSYSDTASVDSSSTTMTSDSKPFGPNMSDRKKKNQNSGASGPRTPAKKKAPRSATRSLQIERSIINGLQEEQAALDVKIDQANEKQTKAREKKERRRKEMEALRARFEGMNVTLNCDPFVFPIIPAIGAFHLMMYSIIIIISPRHVGALGLLPYFIVCTASLLASAAATLAWDKGYRKVVFHLAATVYIAALTAVTLLQLFYGMWAAMVVSLGLLLFTGHTVLVIALVICSRRLDKRRALCPKRFATYQFVSWEDKCQDDVRPDANQKKEIEHESAIMRIKITHHTYPERVTYTKACVETVCQALGAGIIMGTGDLEACSSAIEGAMRRLSTVNSDRADVLEHGISSHRTLHIAKALVKYSQQRGCSLEPELGF